MEEVQGQYWLINVIGNIDGLINILFYSFLVSENAPCRDMDTRGI